MDQIDLVRSKIDLVELINSYVPLKKAGRNYKALCPFHSEKSPSFIVSPELQIFKCFGCGAGGDAFKFLMEYEGMEFGEALKTLADKAGVKLEKTNFSDNQQKKEAYYQANHLASEFYHYVLTHLPAGKKALQYIKKRGIKKSSIETFKIGYAPNNWQTLSDFLAKKKNFSSKDLIDSGLTIKGKSGIYDRFRGRLMFPIWDHRGNVVAFSGRVMDKARENEGKYINSPETLVYHKSDSLYGLFQTRSWLKKSKKAIVVEGELDLISSYQAGVKNVVAIKGSAFTEGQISLLKRYVERLILALDSDLAGQKATLRSIELAESQGLSVRVIEIKQGKDPDDLAQSDPKSYRQLVKKTVSIYDFYIDTALKRYGHKSGEAKKKVSQLVVPALAKIDNEVEKAHYVKRLAAVLDVDEETILKEINKLSFEPGQSQPIRKSVADNKSRQEKLEDYILSLVLKFGHKAEDWLKDADFKLISQPGVKKVLNKFRIYLKNHKKLAIDKFVAKLPKELQSLTQEAFLKEEDLEEDKLILELAKAQKQLKAIDIKQKLDKLSSQIKKAEAENQKGKLIKLETEFTQLSKILKEYL